MIARYITDPAAAVVPRRVRLAAGLEITHHPVEDPAGPGLAHLTYAGALAVAEANGARLPTRPELFLLHQVAVAAGTELAPLTLPDALLRAQGCQPGGPWMVGRDACDRHDAAVLLRITGAIGTGDAPWANAGKHWIGPAPDDLAALCGWWVADVSAFGATRRGPGFVQSGEGFPHNRDHADYGTTTTLVWDVAS